MFLLFLCDSLGFADSFSLSFPFTQLHLRIPSMLIRRDGLLAEPYPLAHNFIKLMSARYVPPASSSTNPMQQRETMPEKQSEGNKKELLPKASSDAGPGVGYAV